MTLLPQDMRLKIERIIEDRREMSQPRRYLGVSELGHECDRYLWYSFRLCFLEEFTSQQLRLFKRGHNEEPIIQADLRRAGVLCTVDPNDQPEVSCCNGHCLGHMDDILKNVPDAPTTDHLGEYKTSNKANFTPLKKKGVKVCKPVHYAQMQVYMRLLKLTRALYIVVCKDNDERYYERVSLDINFADNLIARAYSIITTETPPVRAHGPDWFSCKYCSAYGVCHFGEDPVKTCRTCEHVSLCDEGRWECDLHGLDLSFAQQKKPCKRYRAFGSMSTHPVSIIGGSSVAAWEI